MNPKVAGGATGPNLAAYFLQYILFDGKMRGIFSLMFGAGSWYLMSRAIKRGAGIEAAEVYYRRTLWLMVFGLIHAFLIWHGDILYPYALLGLVLFPLHKAKPKWLYLTAGLAVLAMTGLQIASGFDLKKTHRLAAEADAAAAAHKPLTDEQKDAQKAWQERKRYFDPSAEDLKKESEMYSGSYFHLVSKRAGIARRWHAAPFYMAGWDMLTMMLVGIAFAKGSILTAAKPYSFYVRMLATGYAIGLPIGSVAAWLAYRQNFDALQTVFTFSTYQVARVAMTLGHTAVLLLICKAGWFGGLRMRLAAVGQTALSNYIAHSLIFGFVFYGYGLNLFNQLQRYQLYYVVMAMWGFSLTVTPLWLHHFRFGPLEWCWRSLTYWQRQPMRIEREKAATAA
jgi:uncharacterized protein